jgi:dTDP-4-amino-4,6-dideoxygalactose transaminase
MAVKFLDLRKQYLSLKSEIDQAIAEVFDSSAFVSGKHVSQFEDEFAKYQRIENCIGCGNGTDAIEIALEALDLPPNSEIIVPANTFIATSEAVTRTGHRVVFCDCDPDTYTIGEKQIRAKLTANTRAVIVVHLYGQPCDMNGVMKVALERNLKVIEDCAQAHGADIAGRRVGSIGALGTFSFYPGKNLGAAGDAGAIVTNDRQLARKVRMIANHGRTGKYDHEFEGRNSRLDGLQAAILSVKLRHLDEWIGRRREIASHYYGHLSNLDALKLPGRTNWGGHVFHLFVVRTKRREELREFLAGQGIETGIHYPIALPKLKAYAYIPPPSDEMCANQIDSELLSLPIGDHMTVDDAVEVSSACRRFFGK